jgi:hypothetical protein
MIPSSVPKSNRNNEPGRNRHVSWWWNKYSPPKRLQSSTRRQGNKSQNSCHNHRWREKQIQHNVSVCLEPNTDSSVVMSQDNFLLNHVIWQSDVIIHRGTLQNLFHSKIMLHWVYSNHNLPLPRPQLTALSEQRIKNKDFHFLNKK